MPKSKKQLEHTYTFIDENSSGHTHIYFHHRESIISELWCKNGSTTRTLPRHSDQIHYPTEENTDQNWTGSRLTHSIVN